MHFYSRSISLFLRRAGLAAISFPFWPLLPRSLALIFPFVLAFKNALPCERCTWKIRITLGKVEAYGFYKKLGELMP